MDMPAVELLTEGTAPQRRRVLHVVEGLNLCFLAAELWFLGSRSAALVAGRLLVAAALRAADIALARASSPAPLRRALAACLVAAVGGLGLVAAGTGGEASPNAAFLAFVPIVVGIAIPDEPLLPVASGLAGAAVALAMGLQAGRGAGRLVLGQLAVVSCTFYGTAAALLYRRMRLRAREAGAARAETAAALARSEQRRAEAERRAVVGRLTAELGHDLNSPIASASANLRFVGAELLRAGADADLRDAVQESCQALERVRGILADMRALTIEGPAEAAQVELGPAVGQGFRLAAARLGAPAAPAPRLPPDLPDVLASQPHLAQLVSVLVSAAAGDRGRAPWPAAAELPVALEARVEGAAVRLAVTGCCRPGVVPAGLRPGLGVALCGELAERWGGRVEAGRSPDGRLLYAVTLQRAATAPRAVALLASPA